MIQTTYTLLNSADVDPNFLQQIQSITGSQSSYGYDTPINVVDVLDALGLEPALTCFIYATTDTTALSQVIGIAWVRAHLYAYLAALPNDARVGDLMYYLDLYLQSGVVTPRFDYCGRDLTGPGLIPLSQLTDLETAIQATVDALPTLQQTTTYTLLVFNSGPLTDLQYANALGGNIISLDRDNPVNDPAIQVPAGTTGYTEQPISAIGSNPDVFVNAQFTYDPTSKVYYSAKWKNENVDGSGQSIIAAFGNLAAQGIGSAAVLASRQVTEGVAHYLSQICNAIRVAITNYNSQQLTVLGPKRSRYRQFADGIPATGSGIPEWDTDGQTVMDAGLNRRAELLRDQTYLAQFDTDFSLSLSSTELVAAEHAIQAEMLTTRKAVGLALYNVVNAQVLSADTITDTLAATLRPYLL